MRISKVSVIQRYPFIREHGYRVKDVHVAISQNNMILDCLILYLE